MNTKNELKYCNRTLKQTWEINQPKYICFPTNPHINKTGLCYLFGKCYEIIKDDYPDINQDYTKMLQQQKYSVDIIKTVNYNILLSFPTRYHWKYNTNPDLVKQSCCELYMLQEQHKLIDNLKIYLPLQVDGYVDFDVNQLIQYVQDYLIRIKNLEIILI